LWWLWWRLVLIWVLVDHCHVALVPVVGREAAQYHFAS
jgi:hypothetical protein